MVRMGVPGARPFVKRKSEWAAQEAAGARKRIGLLGTAPVRGDVDARAKAATQIRQLKTQAAKFDRIAACLRRKGL